MLTLCTLTWMIFPTNPGEGGGGGREGWGWIHLSNPLDRTLGTLDSHLPPRCPYFSIVIYSVRQEFYYSSAYFSPIGFLYPVINLNPWLHVNWFVWLCRRHFQKATLNSFVAPSVKDLGTLKKLEVSHDGLPFITQWDLEYAVVKPAWSGNR